MVQHTFTRRALLRAGAATVALAALPVRLLNAVAAQASSTATNTWTFSQWSGLVGSRFRTTSAGGHPTSLELIAASNLLPAGASTTSGPQTFALVFNGDSALSPGQQTVTLDHRELGSVQLFLVPATATSRGQHYEAIVNRI